MSKKVKISIGDAMPIHLGMLVKATKDLYFDHPEDREMIPKGCLGTITGLPELHCGEVTIGVKFQNGVSTDVTDDEIVAVTANKDGKTPTFTQ